MRLPFARPPNRKSPNASETVSAIFSSVAYRTTTAPETHSIMPSSLALTLPPTKQLPKRSRPPYHTRSCPLRWRPARPTILDRRWMSHPARYPPRLRHVQYQRRDTCIRYRAVNDAAGSAERKLPACAGGQGPDVAAYFVSDLRRLAGSGRRCIAASSGSTSTDGSDDLPPGGGRNAEADWKGERRSNETHESSTDADSRLYRSRAMTLARVAARSMTVHRGTGAVQ
jgi:hypothetical protein